MSPRYFIVPNIENRHLESKIIKHSAAEGVGVDHNRNDNREATPRDYQAPELRCVGKVIGPVQIIFYFICLTLRQLDTFLYPSIREVDLTALICPR